MILFGTGGIRGIMKKGEFDEELVKKAASAVADWMNEDNLHTLVIAYDTRRNSMKFARICAETASKKGIRTYVFSDPVPTPLLSFAIRYMNADAGIVITASHNPPEYNGFKVYTKDGVQAIPEYTQRIASLMNTTVPSGNSFGDISPVPDEVEQVYTSKVVQLIEPFVDGIKKIVYSPLHGTGARFVKKVLDSLNMNVITVEEQFHPDTAFSTVETPNPEDESAMKLVKAYMKRFQADAGIATDPDCDRVGLVVAKGDALHRLTGNQVGVLLTDMLGQEIAPGSYLIKTIVTTDMAYPICKERGHQILETPTGFKFIGHEIEKRSETGNFDFFLAFEESCGYLTGDFVRDKDGVIGSALIAALCSKTDPLERLNELYKQYGFHAEELLTIKKKSPQEAVSLYQKLKNYPPQAVGELTIKEVVDYSSFDTGVTRNETLLLKAENVKIYIRPSGTEPKLKIYIKVVSGSQKDSLQMISKTVQGLSHL